jgi:hypothetical protein
LERERKVDVPLNNWLLFAALNEALLRRLGVFWDRRRINLRFENTNRGISATALTETGLNTTPISTTAL